MDSAVTHQWNHPRCSRMAQVSCSQLPAVLDHGDYLREGGRTGWASKAKRTSKDRSGTRSSWCDWRLGSQDAGTECLQILHCRLSENHCGTPPMMVECFLQGCQTHQSWEQKLGLLTHQGGRKTNSHVENLQCTAANVWGMGVPVWANDEEEKDPLQSLGRGKVDCKKNAP